MSIDATTRDVLTDEAARTAAYDHAMAGFPNEACGLLVAGPDGVETIALENLADKYHRLDPNAYPRTSATAYIMNPLAIAKVEEDGKRLVAIFHTHCGYGAYFSEEDQQQARAPRFDPEDPIEARYPGVDYVVLNTHEDGVRGYGVYRFDSPTGTFPEVDGEGDLRGSRRPE